MSNRRGFTTMILWIFISIAGGLFLLFFFILANAQAEAGMNDLAMQALQQVDSILATQQNSPNTYASIPIPDSDINMRCVWRVENSEPLVISQLEIGGFSRPLEYDLVAGNDMETHQLELFTKDLLLPFDMGSVLYVGSIDDAINFTWNDDFKQSMPELLQELPEGIRNKIVNPASLDASSLDTVRIVLVEKDTPSSPPGFPRPKHPEDAVYVHVETDNPLKSGKVRFYRYVKQFSQSGQFEGGEQEFHYSGSAMLFALIWQGNDNNAACFMEKLSRHISLSAELQMERMRMLYDQAYDLGMTTCAAKYSINNLNQLKLAAETTNNNDIKDMSLLHSAVNDVKSQNERMIRGGRRCATIY